jgi:hypothetical protein
MSKRRIAPVAAITVAAVVAVFGLTGGPHAGAATTPRPGKPKPAIPSGPKTAFALDSFGPSATDNVALKWSEQTLSLIRASTLPPTAVSRVLAVVQTSVYDAWAAYDPVAVGTQLGASLRRPAPERTDEHKSMAISYAAYRALQDLFPTSHQTATDFMVALGYDPALTTTDVEASAAAVGNRAAAAVLTARRNDGSNQRGEVNGGAPYSDYTAYQPVNTVDTVNDMWHWQPLRVNGTVQKFATPQWSRVTPFALTRPDQFAVPGPDKSKDYRKQVQNIVKFSAQLKDNDKVVAEYWADGPRTELPPGHSAIFAAALCRMQGDGLDSDVKLLFLQANAALDAGIAAWYYKTKYDFVRPITLVHELEKGNKIKAWGGVGKGTVTMNGEDWQPYQPANVVTPPFAEYVSGHSTFSAASFEVLRSFTGSSNLNLSVTIKKGSSRVEPELVPAKDLTLTWRTMQDAANQSGLSREFGGIHFSDGDLHGRTLGTQIGQAVVKKAQTYFNGTAAG